MFFRSRSPHSPRVSRFREANILDHDNRQAALLTRGRRAVGLLPVPRATRSAMAVSIGIHSGIAWLLTATIAPWVPFSPPGLESRPVAVERLTFVAFDDRRSRSDEKALQPEAVRPLSPPRITRARAPAESPPLPSPSTATAGRLSDSPRDEHGVVRTSPASPTTGLRPAGVDLRLWTRDEPATKPAISGKSPIDSLIERGLYPGRDSLGVSGTHSRPIDWMVLIGGRRYGIEAHDGRQYVHVAGIAIPSPLLALIAVPVLGNPVLSEQGERLSSMRRDIQTHAASAALRKRTEEIRSRKERERASSQQVKP